MWVFIHVTNILIAHNKKWERISCALKRIVDRVKNLFIHQKKIFEITSSYNLLLLQRKTFKIGNKHFIAARTISLKKNDPWTGIFDDSCKQPDLEDMMNGLLASVEAARSFESNSYSVSIIHILYYIYCMLPSNDSFQAMVGVSRYTSIHAHKYPILMMYYLKQLRYTVDFDSYIITDVLLVSEIQDP